MVTKIERLRLSGYQHCLLSDAQSIFNPSDFTTGDHRATSAASDCRNFSGLELSVGSIPASINICLKAGSATIVRVVCAICSMITLGVPAGASRPIDPVTVMLAKPSSVTVGSSDAALRREGLVTARTRI